MVRFGLAASALAALGKLWADKEGVKEFLKDFLPLFTILFDALLCGLIIGVILYLFYTSCRGFVEFYQEHIYPRTKKGRLAIMQDEFFNLRHTVEELLYNSPLSEASYDFQDGDWGQADIVRLETLLKQLKEFGITVPEMNHDPTLQKYLSFILIHMNTKDLEGCIQGARSGNFTESYEEERALERRRERTWMDD